jgi:hypothetical protein
LKLSALSGRHPVGLGVPMMLVRSRFLLSWTFPGRPRHLCVSRKKSLRLKDWWASPKMKDMSFPIQLSVWTRRQQRIFNTLESQQRPPAPAFLRRS